MPEASGKNRGDSPRACPVPDEPLLLIVDDNPDDREQCIRMLGKIANAKYHFVEASSGLAALEKAAEVKPDCILLDYSLPGESGLEILKKLCEANLFLSIIMMTGQGNEAVAVQAMKSGAQHYLIKSEMKPDMLHNAVRAAIEHSALGRKISEQETLQQKLVQQLIESNTQLERFAYIASHDMQEPIRMVTSFSEIIAKDYGHLLDDTGKEYLGLIVSSGQRMRDLVEDLLAYSRMGNEGMGITSFSGESALAGILENLKGLIEQQGACITHDPLPQFYGNPVQFMRLLQNLICNAIKYQSKDTPPEIHIGIEDEGSEWHISVKDNGMGIKEDFIEQIFQPFRRLHTWDNIQGTGLGLAICRKIAESHGGRIWVVSTHGEGSTFHFTLSKRLTQTAEAA